ncbi:flavodoxin family protein [Fodinicola acaciae]|uniref:flavodoxin family protein n=1 Tax=Fodinicola acaciae TaxID=2681555 RepID=UPI0013CF42CB|nr:flavodoxin domain-containing protein [Fodinicola acaciae]
MRALVVYESMFGNTQVVAKAIAAGLSRHLDVDTVEVGAAPTRLPSDLDLLVVGGPTHAFGLSRASTRRDAARQADRPLVSAGIGLRDWLAKLELSGGHTVAATFDTRVQHVPGSAANAAARRLERHGILPIAVPTSFFVKGTPGPLEDGELMRAREWGSMLGTRFQIRAGHLT